MPDHPDAYGNEHMPTPARSHSLWRGGPVLVLVFLFEALLARGLVPGYFFSLKAHLFLTGLLLSVILLAGVILGRGRSKTRNPDFANSHLVLLGLIFWGLISSLLQENTAGNTLYWLLWAMTYAATMWGIPSLLSNYTARDRIRFISGIHLALLILSVVMFPRSPWLQGRFAGIFRNPTWSGYFFAASFIHWCAVFISDSRFRLSHIVLMGGTFAFLLITRTRASIAGALVCALLIFGTHLLSEDRVKRTKSLATTWALVLGLAVMGWLWNHRYFQVDTGRVATFLRTEGGLEGIYEGRRRVWEAGLAQFWQNGLFGHGFLSKYGGEENTFQVMGIRIPRYDWETAADPLNSVLLLSKQAGVPATLLFMLLLGTFVQNLRHSAPAVRPFLLGFVVFGIITAFFNGNWLLSFGDTFDRFSYITLALYLSLPPARAYPPTDLPVPPANVY